MEQGRITGVVVNDTEEIETEQVILATGNSARDIYRLLEREGFHLEAKPFAVGLRIEHPQDLIDKAQYGFSAGDPRLGPAEYHLTYKHQPTGRGVYSFCMCPGGFVVGATSVTDTVVTNGMSYQARDSGVANAAIVVTVNQNDFGSSHPLAGMVFQEKLENRAFVLGGGDYKAPAQRVADFLKGQTSTGFSKIVPSYRPGVTGADLGRLLPPDLVQAIREGIRAFARQVKGFDLPDAVLTGVETRTSAPVRILRDEHRFAVGITGLYPAGEGAGYAGGIVSSALDGWKTAEAVVASLTG
jgi:uncharacterized FAD-dependent dehydrogenase